VTLAAATAEHPDRTPSSDRWRRWLPWVVIAGLLALLGIVGQPSGNGRALDPNGTGPAGAKALVLLLRQYGAQVSVDSGVPAPGVTALLLDDALGPARSRQVAAWVEAGGRLVVADPASGLQPATPGLASAGLVALNLEPRGPCPALGLDNVDRLAVGHSLVLRDPPARATTCFPVPLSDGGTGSFLVAVRTGAGTVVGLGGAGLWTNARLDQQDNAALAVDLLAPARGGRVDILGPSPAGSGSRSVLGLLNPRLKWAVLQLVVAFGLLAWWRGRRLGRPVAETDPVRIAGSEIVSAVGDLMARTRSRDAAARQLRASARAWAGNRTGVGSRASAPQVADAVAARTGGDRVEVLALLADAPVPDDAALVRLAQSLAHFRQEVARGRSPATR